MPNYEVMKDVAIDGFPNAKAGMVIALHEEVAAIHVEAGELKLSTDETAKVYVPGMQPTAGRIVYYRDGERYPAIVVAVREDGALDLLVAYRQGWSSKPGIAQGEVDGSWDWMPFQKDQQLRAGYGGQLARATTSMPKANGATSTIAPGMNGVSTTAQSSEPKEGIAGSTGTDSKAGDAGKE